MTWKSHLEYTEDQPVESSLQFTVFNFFNKQLKYIGSSELTVFFSGSWHKQEKGSCFKNR